MGALDVISRAAFSTLCAEKRGGFGKESPEGLPMPVELEEETLCC